MNAGVEAKKISTSENSSANDVAESCFGVTEETIGSTQPEKPIEKTRPMRNTRP